jgi:hypothetical protein
MTEFTNKDVDELGVQFYNSKPACTRIPYRYTLRTSSAMTSKDIIT